ncbi:MAG: glycosyltransferase family 39 protein, partial [Anaerolineaceae bacterium]|nr:glycosyltransferase family 39 protein [Anaerolineaceae bacterium]
FWLAVQDQGRLWWLVLGGISLAVLVWVAAFPLGVLAARDTYQFNSPGVPLLPLQAQSGWLIGVLALVLFGSLQRCKSQLDDSRFWCRLDWGLVLLIWAAAAFVWIQTPMRETFFAPGPYPPDWALYPYSDAGAYDRTAQFALLGLGLNNGYYVDKPLYSSFLTVLHLIGGQDYPLITALQTAVFALLPALAYLIGRRLHSRAVGVTAALLFIFRGVNAIAGGHLIQTAHSRLFLSEMPTALAMALLTYWMVSWFQKPRDLLYPVLAGGTLGLSTLVRHNPWLLVPVILAASLVVHWRHRRRWLAQAALFGLALVAVIAPWMVYSQQMVGTPWYFMIPLKGVVWKNRYLPELDNTSLVPAAGDGSFTAAGPAAAGSFLLGHTWQTLPDTEADAGRYADVAQFIAVHLLNNLNSTLLTLPDSFVADDLDHTLSPPDSIWQSSWDGHVSVLLAVNIFLVLLGVGAAWRKWRMAGAAPLLVYGGYLLAATAARTSGGRYIVPVDWVVMLYYAIGMVQLTAWLLGLAQAAQQPPASSPRTARWRWAASIAGLLLVVGMIPLAQEAIPINVLPPGAAALPSTEWMLDAGLDPQGVTTFLDQEGAVVQSGRLNFPRLYGMGQGEHKDCFAAEPYPRLVFELLNEERFHCIILPLEEFPQDVTLHASQAVVLGCQEGTAWAVLLPELDLALVRSPQSTPPQCPLPDPICDNNRNCR